MTWRKAEIIIALAIVLFFAAVAWWSIDSADGHGSWRGPVTASWYGPGFYGNTTACGQTFTTRTKGVAHKSLPCGTKLHLRHRGRVAEVRVVDRGPYVAGRTFDLTSRTRGRLRCPDLCRVRWHLGWDRRR